MQFTEAPIRGVWVIDPEFREDERGRFFRAWCSREFAQRQIDFIPVQANMGFSTRKGTVRGMHIQIAPAEEAKLVRCTRGAMFDVAVDLRRDSPTFRQWFACDLTADNGRMLFIPEGCAHGYQTLTDNTEMYYMTSEFYAPNAAKGVRFDDPALAIQWPLPVSMCSLQDRNWELMET